MSPDQTSHPDDVPAVSPSTPAAAPDESEMPPLTPVLSDDDVLTAADPNETGTPPVGHPLEVEILGTAAPTIPMSTRAWADSAAVADTGASSSPEAPDDAGPAAAGGSGTPEAAGPGTPSPEDTPPPTAPRTDSPEPATGPVESLAPWREEILDAAGPASPGPTDAPGAPGTSPTATTPSTATNPATPSPTTNPAAATPSTATNPATPSPTTSPTATTPSVLASEPAVPGTDALVSTPEATGPSTTVPEETAPSTALRSSSPEPAPGSVESLTPWRDKTLDAAGPASLGETDAPRVAETAATSPETTSEPAQPYTTREATAPGTPSTVASGSEELGGAARADGPAEPHTPPPAPTRTPAQPFTAWLDQTPEPTTDAPEPAEPHTPPPTPTRRSTSRRSSSPEAASKTRGPRTPAHAALPEPAEPGLGDTAIRRRTLFPASEAHVPEPAGPAVTEAVSMSEARAAAAEGRTASAETTRTETASSPPGTAGPTPHEEPALTPAAGTTRSSTQRSEDEILLEGSRIVGAPMSRVAAHWAGVLISIVALPVSWFFLHKGAATAVGGVEQLRFGTSPGSIVQLVVGALALTLALWTACRSSLGVTVVGAISTLLGLVTMVMPNLLNAVLAPTLDRLTIHSELGSDLAAFLWSDIVSGRFVAFGAFMIMVGVVSHSARRAGRHEQEVIDRAHRPG